MWQLFIVAVVVSSIFISRSRGGLKQWWWWERATSRISIRLGTRRLMIILESTIWELPQQKICTRLNFSEDDERWIFAWTCGKKDVIIVSKSPKKQTTNNNNKQQQHQFFFFLHVFCICYALLCMSFLSLTSNTLLHLQTR